MNIVETSLSTTASFSSAGASQAQSDPGSIASLQKQIISLMKELKNVPNENLSPKDKVEKSALLQAEIQVLQAQIAAIQRSQQQAEEAKTTTPSEAAHSKKTGQNLKQKNGGSVGLLVDTYV